MLHVADRANSLSREQRFRCFGVPFAVTLPPHLQCVPHADFLPRQFRFSRGEPRFRISLETTGPEQFGIRINGRWSERQLGRRDCLPRMRKQIEVQVAAHCREKVFLHAAMVDWNGTAILLPGRTYSGKSTLAWELVKAGATYLGDEFVLVDGRGGVRAYPTPLTLRGARPRLRMSEATDKGAVRRRPSVILITRFRAGSEWKPVRVTPGEAALRLLPHAVSARTDPARTLQTVTRLIRRVPVFTSNRPDARSAVEWLRNRIKRHDL